MSISVEGVSPIPALQPVTPTGSTTDPVTSARNRSVSSAVKLLNDAAPAGSLHEFSIAIDPTTRQAVVRVVDRATNEVLEQLPSEYLLEVARQLTETIAQQSSAAVDKSL